MTGLGTVPFDMVMVTKFELPGIDIVFTQIGGPCMLRDNTASASLEIFAVSANVSRPLKTCPLGPGPTTNRPCGVTVNP